MVFYALSLFLLIAYVILLAFYSYHFSKAKGYKVSNLEPQTFVTVIIPARNEAASIKACLTAISIQNYQKEVLEIIVVDDQSTDATVRIIKENFTAIKLLQIQEDEKSGKKNAIAKAIEVAKGELIICTDADTISKSNWVATIANFYETKNAAFIASGVTLQAPTTKWNFVQLFQTVDFLVLQGITAASVNNGLHMMSNGANMAFTKAAFIAVEGFKNIDNIATGDDMLLMQKIKDKFPSQVFYLKSKEAIVTSQTVTTWKDFFIQRIRWSSKATYYTDKKLIYTLLLVYCINVASFILLVSLFFTTQNWVWVFLFFMIKSLVEFHFFKKISTYFNQQFLNKYFFLFIPVHIVYIIIAGWFGKFGKVKWKDRMV